MACTRSPTFTSSCPSSSFSSAMSISASLLPPTSTSAVSLPIATMVPSITWPLETWRARSEASNSAAKSSSSLITTLQAVPADFSIPFAPGLRAPSPELLVHPGVVFLVLVADRLQDVAVRQQQLGDRERERLRVHPGIVDSHG